MPDLQLYESIVFSANLRNIAGLDVKYFDSKNLVFIATLWRRLGLSELTHNAANLDDVTQHWSWKVRHQGLFYRSAIWSTQNPNDARLPHSPYKGLVKLSCGIELALTRQAYQHLPAASIQAATQPIAANSEANTICWSMGVGVHWWLRSRAPKYTTHVSSSRW